MFLEVKIFFHHRRFSQTHTKVFSAKRCYLIRENLENGFFFDATIFEIPLNSRNQ